MNVEVCTSYQPTRGELLNQLPLLDYDVPNQPRTMARREWRQLGYVVRQRETPVLSEYREEARYYAASWHGDTVGLYTRDQCVRMEDFVEERESKKVSNEEWKTIPPAKDLKRLKPGARRMYVHLYHTAVKAENATVIMDNQRLIVACGIARKSVKSYRDELVSHGLIQHKFVEGKQSAMTVVDLIKRMAIKKMAA